MSTKIQIKQHLEPITQDKLDTAEQAILLLPEVPSGRWPDFPYIKEVKSRLKRLRPNAGKKLAPVHLDLPNRTGTRLGLCTVTADLSSFELLGKMAELLKPHLQTNSGTLTIIVAGLDDALANRTVEALYSALLAARFRLPSFKSNDKKSSDNLKKLDIIGLNKRVDLKRSTAEAEGNNLARELTSLPPNELTPAIYVQRVRELAKQMGWKMTFHDMAGLKKKKAGAFLAVAQGSADKDAGIVHLRYKPEKASKHKSLALVGKGICFDTGGMNLKPAKHMHGMHEDMEGSAVALGTLLALTRLKVNFPVDCWLALAQNHIGPRAYKQNDIVTAANGKTIEIVHTDAEGRMVLADTLTFASRNKPGLIIDYATLTGTCVYALSTRYSGAFSNRKEFVQDIIDAGQNSGERVWPFPLDEDFDDALKSDTADIKQCTLDGEADHILAARFLGSFIEHNTPWIHIDLSAGNHKGGLAHVPSDITGFGVRFTLNLLLDKGLKP